MIKAKGFFESLKLIHFIAGRGHLERLLFNLRSVVDPCFCSCVKVKQKLLKNLPALSWIRSSNPDDLMTHDVRLARHLTLFDYSKVVPLLWIPELQLWAERCLKRTLLVRCEKLCDANCLSPTDGKPLPGIVEGLWHKVLLKDCEVCPSRVSMLQIWSEVPHGRKFWS